MNELQVQSAIIGAIRALGGHAFKAANQFTVGIPDLSIQLPGYPHVFIEVKLIRGLRRDGRYVLALTPHQRRFILEHRAAGGHAGWLLAVEAERRLGRFVMQVGTAPEIERVCIASPFLEEGGVIPDAEMYRERGGPWPVEQIVRRMVLRSTLSWQGPPSRALISTDPHGVVG